MSFITTKRLKSAKRYALIVIDVSVGFTKPELSPLGVDCPEIIDNIAVIIHQFRELNLPVIYTTVAYNSDSEAMVFREKIPQLNCLVSSENLHVIDPRIAPKKDEKVITKKWASSFFSTDLDSHLKNTGVDGVVITGLSTSGCVRATAVDAIQYGFRPIVIETAVGDRDKAAHEASLRDISIKYGDVMTLTEGLETVIASTTENGKPS